MSDLDRAVAVLSASKKYRSLCTDTIRRVAERELAHRSDLKSAVKSAKRRLHQVYAAFEKELDYDAAYRLVEAAYRSRGQEQIRAACRQILGWHSSTRERLPLLDRFYPAVFSAAGKPSRVLDLGCGLNPLALPWMGLEPGTRYVALDIDSERVAFLNRYLALAGLQPLARCQDILAHPPADSVDVALLLKMSPSLERQEPGATLRLLEALKAAFVVVSFAVKSLGGRERGMQGHYEKSFTGMCENHCWPVQRLSFETELAFVVARGS